MIPFGPFAVVGPSGAGKDTLMEAVHATRPDVRLVRRVITRSEAAGGEAFDGVSAAEFTRRSGIGAFALEWAAHGLRYGIPADVSQEVSAGHVVLFNGSRAMLEQAVVAFPGLRVLHITASDAVLADRLRRRGRETEDDIAARLARARLPLPQGLHVTEIDNSGPLHLAVSAVLDALQPARV